MSMDLQANPTKRAREELPGSDSPAAKRVRDDLLGLLDDFDAVPAGDLDSVMRSLDQEISDINTLASDPVGAVPELGYLQEASDDELGLPTAGLAAPAGWSSGEKVDHCCAAELVRVPSVCSGLGGLFWPVDYGEEEDDYLALDGIFDTSDVSYGGSSCRGVSWGKETLPVL